MHPRPLRIGRTQNQSVNPPAGCGRGERQQNRAHDAV